MNEKKIHHWSEIGRSRYIQPISFEMLTDNGLVLLKPYAIKGVRNEIDTKSNELILIRYDKDYVISKFSKFGAELFTFCTIEEIDTLMREIKAKFDD